MSNTPHNHTAEEDIKKCFKVFPLLAVLILATVALKHFHLSPTLAILIELIKVVIVVGYFIHLINNKKFINLVWILTIIFVAGLLFLPLLNRDGSITGTKDLSKEFQKENAPAAHLEEGGEGVH